MTATITWHGHATFQIAAPGCNILIDPFFTGNPSARKTAAEIDRPDLVLVTHLHDDHAGDAAEICKTSGAALGAIVGAAEVLRDRGVPAAQIINGAGFNIGGTVRVKGVEITMTEAFHTSEAGAPAGYIIRLADGRTVHHAGDTGIFANMAVWGGLFAVDLTLLPTGGLFTMDGRQAAQAAALLKARFAAPMHWGTFPVLAQDTSEFERELALRAPGCRPFLMEPGRTVPLPAA
jgi:L-ascorbate metabolism protein UlaG (beta-lactamase superfamily)